MRNFRSFAGGLGNNLFQFAYIYAQARKGEIPDMYVQDPKYFEGFADEIRQLYSEGIEPIDMVSIHVRRTDYVNNPFYVNLSDTNYYEDAIAEFPKDTKFLVFSDDREFAAKAFPEYQVYEGKDQYDDFNAMAGCKGHIIANSSFSWWAAFVGGGKTVAPKQWHPDGVERTVCPDTWIRL